MDVPGLTRENLATNCRVQFGSDEISVSKSSQSQFAPNHPSTVLMLNNFIGCINQPDLEQQFARNSCFLQNFDRFGDEHTSCGCLLRTRTFGAYGHSQQDDGEVAICADCYLSYNKKCHSTIGGS